MKPAIKSALMLCVFCAFAFARENLDSLITHYEKQLEHCEAGKRNDVRCADAMYELCLLYYDQAKEEFKNPRHGECDFSGRSSPKPPIPHYFKCLNTCWQLSREFPDYPKQPEALSHMGTIYLVGGHLDTAEMVWKQLVTRFPNSPRASHAHFVLADLAFINDNYDKAYNLLKLVKKEQIHAKNWERAHFKKGECAYRMGNSKEAVKYFKSYVEQCDKGVYTYKEPCEESLKYIGVIEQGSRRRR